MKCMIGSALLSFAISLATSSYSAAASAEYGLITGGASYLSTSDQIYQTEIDLSARNHRRDLFWAYPGEAEKGWDFGSNLKLYEGSNSDAGYEGRKATALAARKVSAHTLLEVEAGINSLYNKTEAWTANAFYGALTAQIQVATSLDLTLKINHDYVYQDLIQPGAVTEPLAAVSEYVDGTYRLGERWRFPLHADDRALSDGNEIRETDLAVMYGIYTDTPWIWVGFGGDYLTFRNYDPNYWSPWQFYAFGPRAEIVAPIAYGISGALGLNVNRMTEGSLSPSYGYYGSARLQYGERENFNVALAYTQIVSERDSGEWRLEQIGFEINAPF